jgi:hypothetical protein
MSCPQDTFTADFEVDQFTADFAVDQFTADFCINSDLGWFTLEDGDYLLLENGEILIFE